MLCAGRGHTLSSDGQEGSLACVASLMGGSMVYERQREFSRVGVRLKVRLRFSDDMTVEGTASDVSMKGVRCLTGARPEVGSECAVTMIFAEKSAAPLELRAEGRVVRHEEDGIAVELLAIELESHEHLRNLLMVWAADRRAVSDEFRDHVGLKRRPPEDDLPGY